MYCALFEHFATADSHAEGHSLEIFVCQVCQESIIPSVKLYPAIKDLLSYVVRIQMVHHLVFCLSSTHKYQFAVRFPLCVTQSADCAPISRLKILRMHLFPDYMDQLHTCVYTNYYTTPRHRANLESFYT